MSCCAGSKCCPGGPAVSTEPAEVVSNKVGDDAVQFVVEAVQKRYGEVAREEMNSKRSQAAKEIAASFGYTEEELAEIPEGASLGLSCGNPTAITHLKPGEVVLDLGSGGGMDCFLASSKVGSTGKVIGVDMTEAMIELARSNATKRGATNVEFRLGRIESLPVEDNSVDVVISNCVINLVADKKRAYSEIHRVMKPGGRVAISDIALRKAMPKDVQTSVEAYVGCIAGAQLVDEMSRDMKAAGFSSISIIDGKVDLNVYTKLAEGSDPCCAGSSGCGEATGSASFAAAAAKIGADVNVNDYAMSVKVFAIKDA